MSIVDKVDLVIKNGKVYTSAGFQDLDVGVGGGKVVFISKSGMSQSAERTIDAKDRYVLPGIIDFHVHLRDPGVTHKEEDGACEKDATARHPSNF